MVRYRWFVLVIFAESAESAEAPQFIIAEDIAYAPISCNDDEFERNGECVKRIKSQGNNKPFDLSVFGR